MDMSGKNNPMYGVHRYGKDNPNYGKLKEDAKYGAIHKWVKKNKPKPLVCDRCKEKPPHDLANICNEYNPLTYTRDFNNWRWLCRSCHMNDDGRMERLMDKYNTRRDLSIRSIKESYQRWNWLLS
jgi:hypothetical protein